MKPFLVLHVLLPSLIIDLDEPYRNRLLMLFTFFQCQYMTFVLSYLFENVFIQCLLFCNFALFFFFFLILCLRVCFGWSPSQSWLCGCTVASLTAFDTVGLRSSPPSPAVTACMSRGKITPLRIHAQSSPCGRLEVCLMKYYRNLIRSELNCRGSKTCGETFHFCRAWRGNERFPLGACGPLHPSRCVSAV